MAAASSSSPVLSTRLEPKRSLALPTTGCVKAAKTAQMANASATCERFQPNCAVIGSMKSEKVPKTIGPTLKPMPIAATTMALYPPVGGMIWLIGALMFWWSRIASIATFAVGVSTLAIFTMLAVDDWITFWPYIIYGVIAFGSVFLALRSNREKLKAGEERVVSLW